MPFLTIVIIALIVYVSIIGIGILWWMIIKNNRSISQTDDKKYILLEILVPKNNEKGPLAAESMFASMHGIFQEAIESQEKLSFEIASKGKFIIFYAHIPAHLKDFIEGQIYSQYPTVEISEVKDYASVVMRDPNQKAIVGTELKLNKDYVFPIKTFLNFEVDPLSSITGMLSKIEEGEQLWIQIIVQPIADDWQDRGVKYVKSVKETGKGPESLEFKKELKKRLSSLSKDLAQSAKGVFASSSDSASKDSGGKDIVLPGPVEAALSGINEKITKLGFLTTIRIVCISNDEELSKNKLNGLVGAFKQFNTVNLNGFGIKEILSGQEILEEYILRKTNVNAFVLNIEELASIYHLPNISVETPLISWAGSKKSEPPSNLPIKSEGEKNIVPIGETNFRNYRMQFGIKQKDRRLHIYTIGKTGTGKSTMLENMIIDDILSGRGVAVVDPHGDLIDHVLEFVPDSRIDDVVYFSPADREYPVGFNLLENVDPDLKNVVASGVVGIFKKIFGESWGPRLEYILRNAVLSLLDYPDATMLEIIKILIDKSFRKKVLEYVKDPVLLDFWLNEYDKYDQKFRTEAVAPIQNKVGQFLSTTTIRNIVGQPESTINLNNIMDERKILLIDLSIGKIGEDTAALLGSMMITKIQLSAMQRAHISEAERVDFYLYVDEFQNFATDSFATILSEARKYHLNLVMTNQYIAQMPEIVKEAIFGNVGTLISFRVGAGDSEALVKEFEPIFDSNDLVNLANYNIYVKMAIDGVTSPAFSAVSLAPKKEGYHNRDKIINRSREQYAKSREEVEQRQSDVSGHFDDDQNVSDKSKGNKITKIDDNIYQQDGETFFNDDKGNRWYIQSKTKDQRSKTKKLPKEEKINTITEDKIDLENDLLLPLDKL